MCSGCLFRHANLQLTFSFEGWTDENEGRVDFWIRRASVAAGLRHAVVPTQHQQVGQRSLHLLRGEHTEVNGAPPTGGQTFEAKVIPGLV